jgi:two-component system response regulator QseB
MPDAILVEDDPRLGPLVVRVLSDEHELRWARSIADADALLKERKPAVMIVDRRLPDGDGLDLVASLRRDGFTGPVLILTAMGAVGDRIEGLDRGANDYLVKPFDVGELLARLRALTRDYSSEGEPMSVAGWDLFPATGALYSPYAGRIDLTRRECALLAAFFTEPERLFTRAELLRAAFDVADVPGTIDTYVHYLRQKAGSDIIDTVHGRGYRLGLR